eukprot:TRINITY_DN15820_c0_g1_i1.p2 TRINITY_DN15820_c0_g1~~TRINITY_DN15820_c0_g1_i1.p2  ORF type:complete len:241 (+),score=23.30 TRINITY_DN15820_c0_g1_i1:564-1286(+)
MPAAPTSGRSSYGLSSTLDTPPPGETALSRAVRGAEVASVKELLQAGAGRGVKDASGVTPLHLAVALDSTTQAWEVTRALLDLPGAPIHELDATGYAPLHLAIVGGRAGVAQLLLRANASPDHRTAAGDGACHLAVFARQPLCLRALIESGEWIDLEAVGSLGKTPGQLCDYTDDSLMRWLLELEVRQSKAKGPEGRRPPRDTAVMAAESTALPRTPPRRHRRWIRTHNPLCPPPPPQNL